MLMGSAAAAPGASICVWGSHDARACRAQCSPWRRLEFDISTRSQPRLSHSHRFKRFPSRISMPSKGQSNQFLKLNRRSNNFIWSFHTPFGVHLSPRLVQLTLQHFLVVLVCFGFPFNNHILAADVSAGVSYECMDEIHYYKSLDGLMGKRLEQKLYSLIKSHHVVPYAQVWEALMLLDAVDAKNPEMCSDVVEIYSQRRVSKKLAGKPDGWNREHLWPRSYGLTKGHPDFSDLHNLRPADVNVNSARGNKYYGDCTQKKSKTCYVPANREAALDTATDKAVWLPPSRVRGDIARSLMYMAVRYGSNDPSTNVTLQLSDTPNDANAQMGLLSVLLDWNTTDPPSVEEKLRNARVCAVYQHNRNPFVDHPEYADLIWRDQHFQVLKGLYKNFRKLMKDGMTVVVHKLEAR